mgnify:CR=1 FL=1
MRSKSRTRLTATASVLALALTLGIGLGASAAFAEGDDGHGGGTHPHVQMEGVADIVRAPTDLPPPLAKRGPEHVRVDMKTIEVTAWKSTLCMRALSSAFFRRTSTVSPTRTRTNGPGTLPSKVQ